MRGDLTDYAVLHRAAHSPGDTVEVLTGTVLTCAHLAELPVDHKGPAHADGGSHDLLVLVPYRQIGERGFACHDDAEPLRVLLIEQAARLPLHMVTGACPQDAAPLRDLAFDLDDDAYARLVRTVIEQDIGRGEGANFVMRREIHARVAAWGPSGALAVLGRLLRAERGAHWTFAIGLNGRSWIGASPEPHVLLADGEAVMNPISGTLRYPPQGPAPDDVLRFLADRKERDELFMVLDEELKTMAALCPQGGRVHGPWLKEMTHLAHTEYYLRGACPLDAPEVLRRSMFAPTVTGSPLRNACRVIARRELSGRGYYSGVAALMGRDRHGRSTLDSTILIRTADVSEAGQLRLGVGATIVRDSQPELEASETRTKARGVLEAFRGPAPSNPPHRPVSHAFGSPQPPPAPALGKHPLVVRALADRNRLLAPFWLTGAPASTPLVTSPVATGTAHGTPQGTTDGTADGPGETVTPLHGRRLLLIDAEDDFTGMLALQLRSLGMHVTLRRYDDVDPASADHDIVMLGPGPGDPQDPADRKITRLHDLARSLLETRTPMAGVCLGHQVIASRLGLPLRRRPHPGQGRRARIELLGRSVDVGFYNSFSAISHTDRVDCPTTRLTVRVDRDPYTGEVHALSAPGLATVQFHPESVLTADGPAILTSWLTPLITLAA
ncbi:hypothetical protein ADL00_43180 [Streptomyces sp. AS58]|nr:hypothetical protein ADL00_43180 [Streptomyces sp. AS58]